LVDKSEAKIPLGKPWNRWNTEMDLEKITWWSGHDSFRWGQKQVVISCGNSLCGPQNVQNVTSWGTISFSSMSAPWIELQHQTTSYSSSAHIMQQLVTLVQYNAMHCNAQLPHHHSHNMIHFSPVIIASYTIQKII
jgi:hypothetical protein